MTDQKSAPKGRRYEKTFEIAAPIEQVWQAITEGSELSNWFCESAESKGGVGGYQTVDWGGGMIATQDITVWNPPHQMRAEARADAQVARGLESPEGDPYATEWFLEHEGGVTKVRMVQSGFGEGPMWDGEYDGTYKGWDLFHANLTHYVENYFGKAGASVVLMASATEGASEAAARLFGPEGFCASGTIDGLKPGDPFDFTASTGDRFTGTVRIVDPGKKSLQAIVDSHDGTLTVEISDFGGCGFVWVSLLTWGRPVSEIDALRERLQGMVTALFPVPFEMPAEA